MKKLIRPFLRSKAPYSLRARHWYRRLYSPDGEEWAAILRESGEFQAMGEHCSIQTNVTITDPPLVAMGNNVRMSGCILFGHDGSINMLNRAYQLHLDNVGPIILGDHVFIGHGVIILPNVKIGSRVIIAAGSVVSRDLPDNCLAGGMPAKPLRPLDEHVNILLKRNESYPWKDLIAQRGVGYDPQLEPELLRLRVTHFFGKDNTP